MEDAPKENPATISGFSKMSHRMTAPRIPTPTTLTPITPPLEKATRSAGFRPRWAAAAVRTLARTAIHIPMRPVRPDAAAPTT